LVPWRLQAPAALLSPEGLNIYEIDFHEEAASVKRFFGFPSSQKPASP